MGRILLTYRANSQGFDEPCHVAAAIELLDKHTYLLDPVHPPLSRIAIGLPLYLAGERFPKWSPDDPRSHNYNDVGNSILYDHGHYLRNLSLARSAILPFFAITAVVVFLWTRREFGDFAGLAAAVLFTTSPIVLAFSGMAYTDVPAACMQFAAFFAFANWLEKPSMRSSLLLGVMVGLALLSKMTTLLFFPAGAAGIFLCKWLVVGRNEITSKGSGIKYAAGLRMALLVGGVVLWGGYGFSVGHVSESMQLSPDAMPSFQHFPAPVRSIGRNMVLRDSLLPAPALLKGFATSWVLNKDVASRLPARKYQKRRMVVLLPSRRRREDSAAVSYFMHRQPGSTLRIRSQKKMDGAGSRSMRPCHPSCNNAGKVRRWRSPCACGLSLARGNGRLRCIVPLAGPGQGTILGPTCASGPFDMANVFES